MYRFFLFFMMLLSFTVKAQKDWVRTTDLFGKGCESRYAYGDSVNNLFFADNETRISKINQSFYDLPIDLCHYSIIEVLVFIDSAGNAMDLQILQGSGYDKIDSRIRDKILNFPGLWIPAKSDGKYVSFISRIKFKRYMNTRYGSKRIEDDKNITYVLTGKDYHEKLCEDAEYYYDKGVEQFQRNHFKEAIQLFKKAIHHNQYDLDVIYNLGMSYLKIDDLPNACEWFAKGNRYGDPTAAAAFLRHCGNRK